MGNLQKMSNVLGTGQAKNSIKQENEFSSGIMPSTLKSAREDSPILKKKSLKTSYLIKVKN